jgi:ABC-2 type transport system ATP-binding protein
VPVRAAHRPATRAESSVDEAIEASGVIRRFDTKVALDKVELVVRRGEIRALLGPNGAGKTTLLRILSGLLDPHEGSVRVLGSDVGRGKRELRQRIGLVPSGDRSFYLRLSGLENLAFFARLHGLSRPTAVKRSLETLEEVGLVGAERKPVGLYSHGMQKRLSVGRALLMRPAVLLIDEATHDLDPDGARQVRELVTELAHSGSAILWATQRLDEIRGFADSVTLISHGHVCFAGTVPELMAHALPQRYLLRVRNGTLAGKALEPTLQAAIGETGTISALANGSGDDFVLALAEETLLSEALRPLLAADIQIYACREERSEIEDAFIRLTRRSQAADG